MGLWHHKNVPGIHGIRIEQGGCCAVFQNVAMLLRTKGTILTHAHSGEKSTGKYRSAATTFQRKMEWVEGEEPDQSLWEDVPGVNGVLNQWKLSRTTNES